MRVTVPRRIIGLGILLTFLSLSPAITSPAFAIPKPWEDKRDSDPPSPKGDGDGTVVKATGSGSTTAATTMVTARISARLTTMAMMKSVLQMMRLGYGLRWYP